jgi:hypothetical protein
MTRWLALALVLVPMIAAAGPNQAPPDAELYFIAPTNGQTIRRPFWDTMGLRNMGVTRAGDKAPGAGHHHLLIDVDEKTIEPDEPIPQDKNHLHFGAGQTEARIELPPGRHTLQLVLGDSEHLPFGNPPLVSKKITVNVVRPRKLPLADVDEVAVGRDPATGNRTLSFETQSGDTISLRLGDEAVQKLLDGLQTAPPQRRR